MFFKTQDKTKYHNRVNCFLAGLLLLFSIYSFYLMEISPFEYLRFFAFVFAGIFCSGLFFTKWIKCDNSAELYSYSIGIGIAINAFIYAACGFLNHLELYKPLALIAAAVSLVLLIIELRKKTFTREHLSLNPVVITAIIIMLFMGIFIFSFRYISPKIIGENLIFPDILWSLSNINALTQSFPPKILRLNIGAFDYHYFAMLVRAFLSLVTDISTDKVFFALGQFLIVPFLIISIYAVFEKILKSSRNAKIGLVVFLLSGSASSLFYIFGVKSYFSSRFFSGLWAYPNGSDVGISFLCLWILSFVKIYDGKFITAKINKPIKFFLQLGTCAAICFFATLSKGPFGAVCVAAAVGVPFCLIFQKKPFLKTLFYSLSSVGGFLVATIFFISSTGESNALYLSATIKNSLFWRDLIAPIITFFTGETAFLGVPFGNGHAFDPSIFFLPLHVILIIFPSCLFMIFLTVRLLKSFKDIPFETLILLGAAYSGLICGYVFNYRGASQAYFILAAHLPVTALGLQWFFSNYQALKKSAKTLIIIAFAFSFITGITEYSKFTATGFQGFTAAATKTDATGFERDKSCTREEYEAAIWIKENTPQDSIVATNRHYITPPEANIYPPDWWNARYYYLSAYSNRQMFIEGWGYTANDFATQLRVRQIYEANLLFFLEQDNNKPQLMKAVDVDYIYVSKHITPLLELKDIGLEKVFSNHDVDIYAIK